MYHPQTGGIEEVTTAFIFAGEDLSLCQTKGVEFEVGELLLLSMGWKFLRMRERGNGCGKWSTTIHQTVEEKPTIREILSPND